jgi:uncharacterized protein (TIGR03118 family)
MGTKSTPTGVVFNTTSGFPAVLTAATFLFSTEGGTIAAWHPSLATLAVLKVDNSGAGAVYKGLALGSNASGDFLFATNFSAGTIDVFDDTFTPTTLAGLFTDPTLPSGYAPFGIQNLGGELFVTYALQAGRDDVPGPGNGFVDAFDTNGNLLRRVVTQGALNSPWGLALSPMGFGMTALLVGNFGDGRINAFDPTTGMLLGPLLDGVGSPIAINGLWGLIFGNGGNGGQPDILYFTAGINQEQDGLLGALQLVADTPTPGDTPTPLPGPMSQRGVPAMDAPGIALSVALLLLVAWRSRRVASING